jgi:D-sedoheptulose 7-phosphate isomerase
MEENAMSFNTAEGDRQSKTDAPLQRVEAAYPPAIPALRAMIARYTDLEACVSDLVHAFEALMGCFRSGGTLYICGNGGSMADALHIAGELDKSFRHPRKLGEEQRRRLLAQPDGEALADHLQQGLRTIPLGTNPALMSAIANDNPLRDIGYAQELYALARAGDVLLAISTSGNASNVRYAASTAHALQLTVISLTGSPGGLLAKQADIAIRAPGENTPEIQSWHIQLYHTLCDMLEAASFSS